MGSNCVKEFELFKIEKPLTCPLSDSSHALHSLDLLVLRIRLENGIVGEGYMLAFQYSRQSVIGAFKDFSHLIIGLDVSAIGEFHKIFENESEYFGHSGLQRWIQSIVDIASWDAMGKVLNLPVWRLIGARERRIKAYGSGGWLSYSIDELIAETKSHISKGFRSVKIKVGSEDIDEDILRIVKVREVVGSEVELMVDANQAFDYARALEFSKLAEPYRLTWFEEPIASHDFDGYAKLRSRSNIPLSMGEREFNNVTLRELVTRRAIDYWQPDILRIGGVRAWLSSAALAEAYNIGLAPHFYKEYDVPLQMCVSNGVTVECFDWVDSLIDNPTRIADGFAYPHDGPGWGFSFKDDFLDIIDSVSGS